jgi:hypothetical protein
MKKNILFLTFFVTNICLWAQDMYDNSKIHTIEIQFAFNDWDAKMDAAALKATDPYTVAVWCKINGERFDSVGVKFKGNSSYQSSNKKNPLHIALDFVKGKQDYNGTVDIKLSNGYSDPTFIREALSYQIVSDYMECSRTSFTNVYINGKKYGLFTNVESVSKRFMRNRFGENDGVIVKCTPASFNSGGGPGNGFCTLKYLGADSSLYKNKYDMKTLGGFKSLITLCDTLTNKPTAVAKVLDVNRALWMLAINMMLVNMDSYTGAFCQNYYLYKDKTERFLPIMWDFNMSFNGFPAGTSSGSNLTPFYNITNNDRPLIKNILANARYKKMYIAHLRTIKEDWFENGKYLIEGQKLQTLIDTAFNNDPNKMSSYANFKVALNQNIAGMNGASGIKPLMEARVKYLNGLADFTKKAPTVAQILPFVPIIGEELTIKVTINNATAAFFNYRNKSFDVFNTLKMFNDGTNGDDVANDSIWTIKLTPQNRDYQYYIWAENADAGVFSPRQAEHQFHTFSPTTSNGISAGAIVINEFMANNKEAVVAPNGKNSDWIELYNTTNADIDLSNAALSDNFSIPKKWIFPNGTTIKANDYLIIWADDADTGAGLHAAFKLADNGERVILSDGQGTVLDSLTFPNQKQDFSYARCPNATGNFIVTEHTFSKSNGNCKPVSSNEVVFNELTIYPNPTNDKLWIRNHAPLGKVVIFDVLGRFVKQTNTTEIEVTLDTSDLEKGIYFVKGEFSKTYKIIKQ